MIPRLGIELEYMIVDRDTLDVKPIADQLIAAQAGEITGEVEVGAFCWSNELVLHVVELKTNGPVESLAGVAQGFQSQVTRINELLARWNACLLPTAMHPWMDPLRETVVWPHDNNEVYAAFDRIFSCRGHGWSNLQSMHINVPFGNDEEFGRLHAAIRVLLPILPALAASSPLMDGRATGLLDNRLNVYRTNCAKIPSLTGDVIPEPVFTPDEYQTQILDRIYRDLRPHDPEGTLQYEWANARGAIARFDRNTIEIRVLDVQECPAADLAIAAAVKATLEALMDERWSSLGAQKACATGSLHRLLLESIRAGDQAVIDDPEYLAIFGVSQSLPASALWTHILGGVVLQDAVEQTVAPIDLVRHGSLARRILTRYENPAFPTPAQSIYHQLARNLQSGTVFALA